MGERLPSWSPTRNGSVHVQLSSDATTSDAGGLILREVLDISGVISALDYHLVDPRDPLRVRHSLTSQLRTVVLQRAMGWRDLSDTDVLGTTRSGGWRVAMHEAWYRWRKHAPRKPRYLA